MYALKRDGTVLAWGANEEGQLGDGTTTSRLTAAPVTGVTDIVAITSGETHACGLSKTGVVSCWGYNYRDQLGTTGDHLTAVTLALTSVTEIAAEAHSTCARKTDGSVVCWGDNEAGALGDGTNVSRSTAAQVSGLSAGVAHVYGGGLGGGYGDGCALLTNGTAKCWGYNSVGQLGTGTSSFKELLPIAVSGLTTATSMALGGGHSCALLADATVACWGINIGGQLGDGTTTARPTATPVPGLSDVASIAAGEAVTCAITKSGRLSCWGLNGYANVGTGTTTSFITTPTFVVF